MHLYSIWYLSNMIKLIYFSVFIQYQNSHHRNYSGMTNDTFLISRQCYLKKICIFEKYSLKSSKCVYWFHNSKSQNKCILERKMFFKIIETQVCCNFVILRYSAFGKDLMMTSLTMMMMTILLMKVTTWWR